MIHCKSGSSVRVLIAPASASNMLARMHGVKDAPSAAHRNDPITVIHGARRGLHPSVLAKFRGSGWGWRERCRDLAGRTQEGRTWASPRPCPGENRTRAPGDSES